MQLPRDIFDISDEIYKKLISYQSHKQNGLGACIILKIQMYDSSSQHIVKFMQFFTIFFVQTISIFF